MSEARAYPIAPHEWLSLGAILLVSSLLLLLGEFALFAAIGIIVSLVALPFARYLIAPFVFFLLGLCTLASEIPVTIGVKWYGADAMLFFLAVAGFAFLYRGEAIVASWDRFERRVAILLLVSTIYGVFSVAVGLFARDFPANEVLGDFRRRFFYPLVLLVPLILPLPRDIRRHVSAAVVFAALCVVAIGGYRAATGSSWEEERYTGRDDIVQQLRYLSYAEATTAALALGFFSAFAAARRRSPWRTVAVVAAVVCAGLMMISGWRLAVLLCPFTIVAALALVAWTRGKRTTGLLGALAATVIILLIGLGFLFILVPENTVTALETLEHRFGDVDPRDDMRYYAWREAMREFSAHPIIGAGLGHQLFYFHRSTGGVFVARYSSAHNSYIDSLYQTGAIGFLLFMALHVVFVVHFLRHFRRLPEKSLPLCVGMFMGYGAILAFSFLEPLQVGAIVTQYLLMGLCIYFLRASHRPSVDSTT